jgi:hypothetical protein
VPPQQQLKLRSALQQRLLVLQRALLPVQRVLEQAQCLQPPPHLLGHLLL